MQLYNRMRPNLEILVAHEMAHQWWYQIVHNDPINAPWLDEGIAEYSVKLYKEALSGPGPRRSLPVPALGGAAGNCAPAAPRCRSTVRSIHFKNGNQYETIVYGKGALFYDELRADLGDRQFRRFLQTYLNAHKYGYVTDDDFLAALHVVGQPALVRLYREWVGEEVLQAAQTSSATP